MKLNDQQLDDLLRSVPIPGALKQRLRAIPDQPSTPDREWASKSQIWLAGLAIAAGLTGIVAWLAWTNDGRRVPEVAQTETHSNLPETVADQQANAFRPSPPQPAIDRLNMEIDALNSRIKLYEAELRLAELAVPEPALELSSSDCQSLIVALSDQSGEFWGAKPESILRDMQNVINRYPGSAGAKIASQYLANAENRNQQ